MARTTSERATKTIAIVQVSIRQAATMAYFSPRRSATMPAGRSPITWASALRAVMKAANPTLAPSARAWIATSGITAPNPMDAIRVGP